MMTLLPAAGGAALTEPVFNVPDELAAPIRQGDAIWKANADRTFSHAPPDWYNARRSRRMAW